MPLSAFASVPTSDDAPVLLVLLPSAAADAAQAAWLASSDRLDALQNRLGTAIRVIRIDAASHPAVVRSFDGRGLPAFVLLQHGIERWRQPGLPDGEPTALLLLSKLVPPVKDPVEPLPAEQAKPK